MSSNSVDPNGQQRSFYREAIASSLAAGAAFTPVMHWFEKKTSLQLGEQPPKFSVNSLVRGVKAAPNVGAVIGTQVVAQKALKHVFEEETTENMLASAALVGVVSTPFLAGLNGRTQGFTFTQSLRRLSLPQTGAISVRESLFLMSLLNPLNPLLKEKFGDNETVATTSAAISGASGSLAGHPADTALSRLQANVKVIPSQLMRGALTKSVGTGAFAALYHLFSEQLK